MNVDFNVLIPILFIVAIGSYIQAVVGFAFGLIFLSFAASINLLPVSTIAILISLLALVNTATALYGSYKKVLWPQVGTALLVGLPMIWIGLFLLDYLAANNLRVFTDFAWPDDLSLCLYLVAKTKGRSEAFISLFVRCRRFCWRFARGYVCYQRPSFSLSVLSTASGHGGN